ncbi:unnamed protein product [Urochloa decumbens]|uniref:Uncharacterized protein n=1 Tax=Urochloa decumbens TaxID=240449 RepID=A0ABC9GB17_9POAL
MNGDTTGGGRVKLAPATGPSSPLANTIFHFCMKTAIALGSCYVVFVVYIAVITQSWLEKLRVLPLLIVAVTVPLLGAVLIQK